jgi:hypothetical protein
MAETPRADICQRTMGETSFSGYGPVGSVNRLVRLPASGGDPLAMWCGGWGRKTPGYPIPLFLALIKSPLLFLPFSRYLVMSTSLAM